MSNLKFLTNLSFFLLSKFEYEQERGFKELKIVQLTLQEPVILLYQYKRFTYSFLITTPTGITKITKVKQIKSEYVNYQFQDDFNSSLSIIKSPIYFINNLEQQKMNHGSERKICRFRW